mgnify:CR=1 FL=1
MAQRNLRFVAIGANDVTFADPSDVTRTSRFVGSLSNVKTVAGLITVNRLELVSLRDVEAGSDVKVKQQSSVRIKVSSPLGNSVEAKQQILDALHNMELWINAGGMNGFKPTQSTEFIVDLGA